MKKPAPSGAGFVVGRCEATSVVLGRLGGLVGLRGGCGCSPLLAGGGGRLGLARIATSDLGHVLAVVRRRSRASLPAPPARRTNRGSGAVRPPRPIRRPRPRRPRGHPRPHLSSASGRVTGSDRTGTVLPAASDATERPSAAAAGGASTDVGRAARTTPAERASVARATSRPRTWRVNRCTMGDLRPRGGPSGPRVSTPRTNPNEPPRMGVRSGPRARPRGAAQRGRGPLKRTAAASQASRARAAAAASNSQARSRPAGSRSRDQMTSAAMRPAAATTPAASEGSAPRNASQPSATDRSRHPQDRVQPPRPLESEPRRDRHGARPPASRSRSARAFAIARAAPASTAIGIEGREEVRQGPGRPEPAVDGQDRDPDRERQPRPGRALGHEVVAVADQRARRPRAPRAGRSTQAASPTPSAAPPTTTARATGTLTSPAGIGLPGLRPASSGASWRSLSAPIETWSAVIDTPSWSARPGPAPATSATAATTSPSSDRRKRMDEPDEPPRPGRGARQT